MAFRWGICCAGKISHDFACALGTLDPATHTVAAVAARSLERAKGFAEVHQIPQAYGSYEELAADENIDIIYIGSVNTTHLPLCKLFLNHNKNVLCEKPLALNVKEVQEILSLAKEKDLFLMEGVWSRFFPVYHKIRDIIANNQIGEVKMVTANLTAPVLQLVEYLGKKDLGGGIAYALGIYTIQFALLAFKEEQPSSVSVSGHLTSGGVDACGNITLLFPGNKMAALVYSGTCQMTCDAEIAGTEGRIKLYDTFWSPTRMDVTTYATGKTESLEFPLPVSKLKLFFPNSTGLRYEAEAVRQAIKEGKKEHPYVSHKTSKMLASILEKVRNSLGYYVEGDATLESRGS